MYADVGVGAVWLVRWWDMTINEGTGLEMWPVVTLPIITLPQWPVMEADRGREVAQYSSETSLKRPLSLSPLTFSNYRNFQGIFISCVGSGDGD